jgi:hypothetical protein
MVKCLIIFSIFSNVLLCQSINSTEELINKYLSREVKNDISEDYCCEMLEYYKDQPNFGSQISSNTKISYRKLEENQDQSVYCILLEDSTQSSDFYIHMKNENGWKIEAFRALALPGFVFMLLDSMKTMDTIPDSMKMFYDKMLMATKTDAQLKEYFKMRHNDYEKLLSLFSSHPEIKFINNSDNYGPDNLDKELTTQVKSDLNSLSIDCIERDDQYNGLTFFIVFGMIDNEVGFFYADESAEIPKISSSRFIYIEKIFGNWYIYKTT